MKTQLLFVIGLLISSMTVWGQNIVFLDKTDTIYVNKRDSTFKIKFEIKGTYIDKSINMSVVGVDSCGYYKPGIDYTLLGTAIDNKAPLSMKELMFALKGKVGEFPISVLGGSRPDRNSIILQFTIRQDGVKDAAVKKTLIIQHKQDKQNERKERADSVKITLAKTEHIQLFIKKSNECHKEGASKFEESGYLEKKIKTDVEKNKRFLLVFRRKGTKIYTLYRKITVPNYINIKTVDLILKNGEIQKIRVSIPEEGGYFEGKDIKIDSVPSDTSNYIVFHGSSYKERYIFLPDFLQIWNIPNEISGTVSLDSNNTSKTLKK